MTNEDYTFRSTAVVDPNPTSFIFLRENTEEVIRLDKEGFHYKGEFIADAGEAHRLMVAFLKQNTHQPEKQGPTDEELDELFVEIDQSGESESWRAYARAVLTRWGK
jgi:Tfp pilus assembly protein PilO